MTTRPCERCEGSGTEPDPLDRTHRELCALISRVENPANSAGLRGDLAAAAGWLYKAARDRQHELEALLDEILGALGTVPPRASHMIMQVPAADVQAWRERRAG